MNKFSTGKKQRKTKIVCTLGPAVASDEKLRALIGAGMDMARINCSHGEPKGRLELIRQVRRLADEMKVFLPIMMDLQGPKIRLGRLEEPIHLKIGQTIEIETGDFVGNEKLVSTTYPFFARDVSSGDKVLVDDGKICLEVESVKVNRVQCRVLVGGLLKERKGMNLPDTEITAPCLSEKDLADLKMAVQQKVDFLAISFVRHPNDLIQAKEAAARFGDHQIRFIAKIERPEALKTLIPIINVADGVMVARGDLGVEIGSHRVPMIQKEIISRANLADKYVITATQMLDSMMERPVPTRAEASDIANAIIDGTDACMLSGETATGDYPLEAVRMMDDIALETEGHAVYAYRPAPVMRGSIHRIADGLSVAAYQTANLMGAKLLVAFTNSGGSALKLSKKHPETLIVGATIHEHIARRMRAYWGVVPILLKNPDTIEDMLKEVTENVIALGMCRKGDMVVLTSGFPLWTTGSSNLMKLIEIGTDYDKP